MVGGMDAESSANGLLMNMVESLDAFLKGKRRVDFADPNPLFQTSRAPGRIETNNVAASLQRAVFQLCARAQVLAVIAARNLIDRTPAN